jgi:hypothetical protein
LVEQIGRALAYEERSGYVKTPWPSGWAEEVVLRLLRRIPELRRVLNADVSAAFEGDPAAKSVEEVVFSYPVVEAITAHRIAHVLYSERVPIVPRIIAEYAHGLTGVDIHPGAQIGPGFFLDHGTGVVIGETSINGIAKIPGDHVVGLVAAADTGLGKSWLDGVKAAAAKTDNVKIVGAVYTGDDSAKALPQVNALLTAHPEITDIVTHMGTTTPGAVAAIKAKKREGKTFLSAVGIDNGGKEGLEDGTVSQIFLQDICALGTDMADGVVDKAEGKEPKAIPIKVAVAGKDDLQSYLDKGWS